MTLRFSAGLSSDAKASAASFSPREGVDSAVGGGESGKEPVVFASLKWAEREEEPKSFAEAMQSVHWRRSMDNERHALGKSGCWRIVDTPQGVLVIN